jgi:hypothetical protein
MKVLKVIIAASAFCLALAGICSAVALVPEGTVTAINSISASSAVTSLNFNTLGTAATIATITIENNYENAFDLKLAFTNNGVFKRVAAAGGDGITATGVGAQVPITLFTLHKGGGTLGAGLTDPSGTTFSSLTTDAGGDYYIWDTQHKQTTATVGYQLEVQADWVADTRLLQGTYRETLTATLTVGDGQ